MATLPKPSRTARKKAQLETRRDRINTENKHKRTAKIRDGYRCRFPLCGCKALGLRLEASHDQHKGIGGNPEGDRSTPAGLITLCVHRHQDGTFSRHRGTLRSVYLSARGNNGPVAWEIDAETLRSLMPAGAFDVPPGDWIEVARERAVQQLEPLKPWQADLLGVFAQMDC